MKTNKDLVLEALLNSSVLSYNDSYGGEEQGWTKRTIRELARRLDALDTLIVDATLGVPVLGWCAKGDNFTMFTTKADHAESLKRSGQFTDVEAVCSAPEVMRRITQASTPIAAPGLPEDAEDFQVPAYSALELADALRRSDTSGLGSAAAAMLDAMVRENTRLRSTLAVYAREVAQLTDRPLAPRTHAADVLVVGPGWNETVRALPGREVAYVAVLAKASLEDRDNAVKSISKHEP